MAGLCLECWRGTERVLPQQLTRVSDSATFRSVLAGKLSDLGLSVQTDGAQVEVSATGKGDWKFVDLDEDVGLTISFGCHYVKFNLRTCDHEAVEPAAKRSRTSLPSAFDVLTASAARRDCLPPKVVAANSRDELFNDLRSHVEVSEGVSVFPMRI